MGGGSSSATPTTPPGYSGGSVMDYTAPTYSPSPVAGTGFDWHGFGSNIQQGFNAYGQGVAGGASPPSNWQAPQSAQTTIPEASIPFSLIPESAGGNNEILQLLQRLGIM